LVNGQVVAILFLNCVFLVAHRVAIHVLEGLRRSAGEALLNTSAVLVFEKLVLKHFVPFSFFSIEVVNVTFS
jgi:hypothetical protein